VLVLLLALAGCGRTRSQRSPLSHATLVTQRCPLEVSASCLDFPPQFVSKTQPGSTKRVRFIRCSRTAVAHRGLIRQACRFCASEAMLRRKPYRPRYRDPRHFATRFARAASYESCMLSIREVA
jgi:hypothetical protein